MAKKQMVQRHDRNTDVDHLSGRVEDTLHFLNGLLVKYGPDTYMEIEDGYDSYSELVISYEEEETDKELERRLARGKKRSEKNKADKEKKVARELSELARLQKKYGEQNEI